MSSSFVIMVEIFSAEDFHQTESQICLHSKASRQEVIYMSSWEGRAALNEELRKVRVAFRELVARRELTLIDTLGTAYRLQGDRLFLYCVMLYSGGSLALLDPPSKDKRVQRHEIQESGDGVTFLKPVEVLHPGV